VLKVQKEQKPEKSLSAVYKAQDSAAVTVCTVSSPSQCIFIVQFPVGISIMAFVAGVKTMRH